MLTTIAPTGSNIDSTVESLLSARIAGQGRPVSKLLSFAPAGRSAVHAQGAVDRAMSEGPGWVDTSRSERHRKPLPLPSHHRPDPAAHRHGGADLLLQGPERARGG